MSLKLNKDSNPEDVLLLPKGKLITKDLPLVSGIEIEIVFGPKTVVDSASLIIINGHFHQVFHTQAEIISYSNNNFVLNNQTEYL